MGTNIVFIILFFVILSATVKILPEWERGVVLRLGRAIGVRGPGPIILIPGVERLVRVDTRTITMDIPPQDVITNDNISMKVNAVIYFRVVDPEGAVVKMDGRAFIRLVPIGAATNGEAGGDGRDAQGQVGDQEDRCEEFGTLVQRSERHE